jgi:anti-anti-sigma regulatory factor
MAPSRTPVPTGLAEALDAGLLADARFVASARLLAALHQELRRGFGDRDARAALLQAGAYHGHRDALVLLRDDGPRSRRCDGPAACASPLVPLRFTSAFDAFGERLLGSWDGCEADAARIASGAAAEPACCVSAGYASGWLSALRGVETLAVERTCRAAGDAACTFEARDTALWQVAGDAAAAALAALLPLASVRAAATDALPPAPEPPAAAFDPQSPAVHVWGPVMVVPYAGEDTAVTIETVARDPGAASVSVVVVDLDGAVVDDGFGAVALERIVDTIQGWGAEAVLTGLSPLAESVVAGLAGDPIVLRKDLQHAIAAAFRIAESQRQAQ